MMVSHRIFGTLIRKCRERRGGLDDACVVSERRRRCYDEVVNLCHKRIYEDNLEGLWGGDREKMPTPQALQAKLFETNTTVIHACLEDQFAGGAIIKEYLSVAHAGESGVNVSSKDSHPLLGTSLIGYVDSCASTLGSHAGSAIWGAIQKMRFLCVACHSILLQDTVHFWMKSGMRRYDPADKVSQQEFSTAILMRTHGTVVVELEDIQKALPASKLPLFIWIPGAMEVETEIHQEHIFTPDPDVADSEAAVVWKP